VKKVVLSLIILCVVAVGAFAGKGKGSQGNQRRRQQALRKEEIKREQNAIKTGVAVMRSSITQPPPPLRERRGLAVQQHSRRQIHGWRDALKR
jgi:type II secretory pathway component PulJ